MKIWFDTRLTHQSTEGECGGGRECECMLYDDQPVDAATLPWQDNPHYIRTKSFQQAELLHLQKFKQDSWIVCHPARSGCIAVLDSEAVFLLKQFQKSRSLLQITQALPGWSVKMLEKAIALFLRLEFLQDTNANSVAPLRDTAQTLTTWLHVTNACNLRCPYCYLHKTSEHMADDTARRAIDATFRSAMKHNIKHVKLKYAGGEASLHLQHVIAIHNYAAQLAQQHGITFNAVLLSNGVALSQRAIDHLKAQQIAVMISLDGLGDYHDRQRPFIKGQGSFQYVNRTINRLLASDLTPNIAITVSRRNLAGLPALVKYILERDMPFTLNYYRENECSDQISNLRFEEEQMIAAMRSSFAVIEEHLPRRSLLDSLIDKASMQGSHRHTCGVGQAYLVIDQNGGIAKCHADITRQVATINVDDPLQALRDDPSGVQGLSVDDKEGCKDCDWRYWCTGGCPLLTFKATGRSDVKSPNCGIYKALFPEALRLEALRLLRYLPPIILSTPNHSNNLEFEPLRHG